MIMIDNQSHSMFNVAIFLDIFILNLVFRSAKSDDKLYGGILAKLKIIDLMYNLFSLIM